VNIICRLPRAEAWVRAAKYLGHNCYPVDPKRPLDVYKRHQADIILHDGQPGPIWYLNEHNPFLIESPGPAANKLPTDRAGKVCPEFVCNVALFSNYDADYTLQWVRRLVNDIGVEKFKIFGNVAVPVPQYVGRVSWEDTKNIFVSANVVLSLDVPNDESFHRDVYVYGGRPWPGTTAPESAPLTTTYLEKLEDVIKQYESLRNYSGLYGVTHRQTSSPVVATSEQPTKYEVRSGDGGQ